MKVEIISKDELEPFMQYNKLEGIMVAKLDSINRISELKLRMLKELSSIATKMKIIKEKHKFKTDYEMMKIIRKHAQW